MEAAVGAQTNADIATKSGIKRIKADELLKMNQTRSEKDSNNFIINPFLTGTEQLLSSFLPFSLHPSLRNTFISGKRFHTCS